MKSEASGKRILKLVKKGVLFCAPFLLFSAAVTLASIWVFQNFISNSVYFDAITMDPTVGNQGDLYEDPSQGPSSSQSGSVSNPSSGENQDPGSTEDPSDPTNPDAPVVTEPWELGPAPPDAEVFPSSQIKWGKKWATLNVDGWKRKDIPVIFGSNESLLKKGACMDFKSSPCGKGRTILSAHVNSYFKELEDVQLGDIITIDTVYGRYRYEVINMFIFDYRDTRILYEANEEEEDVLFMYTCYPRKNPYVFKDQRLAVVARLIEGKDWKEAS